MYVLPIHKCVICVNHSKNVGLCISFLLELMLSIFIQTWLQSEWHLEHFSALLYIIKCIHAYVSSNNERQIYFKYSQSEVTPNS